MNKIVLKLVPAVLLLTLIATMFSGCNKQPAMPIDTAALTIEVDGQETVIHNTMGKTISEILVQAGVVLNEGDTLSVSGEQLLTDDLRVTVLRRNKVTVTVTAENPEAESDETAEPIVEAVYSAVLMGGTVKDALDAVGVTLAEDQTTNHALDKRLENNMDIIVMPKTMAESDVIADGETTTTTAVTTTTSAYVAANTPTGTPTRAPVYTPTRTPTAAPTQAPTTAPTQAPTDPPTEATQAPTDPPSQATQPAPTEPPTPTEPTAVLPPHLRPTV